MICRALGSTLPKPVLGVITMCLLPAVSRTKYAAWRKRTGQTGPDPFDEAAAKASTAIKKA